MVEQEVDIEILFADLEVVLAIAAALPVFREQGFGHFVNIASTAGLIVRPTMAVYAGTKFALRAISEGSRQEAGETLRVTVITPGFVHTDFMGSPHHLLKTAR